MNTAQMHERDSRAGSRPQRQGHGWHIPIGLGFGLLSVGAFFVLVAHGISVLASIGY